MTNAAELAGSIKIFHHRLRVPIKVRQDFLVGNFSVDRLAVRIDQNGWNADHVTARTPRIDLLDRMADGTGDPVLVEMAVNGRALGQRAGNQGDRVMATLAMAREFNPSLVPEQVCVLDVPGCTE